jgi:hypothetical protein
LVFSGANPAADRILGVNCQRYLGKTIEEAFPPLAATEVPERYRAAAADGIPWHTEQIVYTDELIRAPTKARLSDRPATIAVVFTDITDCGGRWSARERARTLAVRVQSGRLPVDPDGKITDCNDGL